MGPIRGPFGVVLGVGNAVWEWVWRPFWGRFVSMLGRFGDDIGWIFKLVSQSLRLCLPCSFSLLLSCSVRLVLPRLFYFYALPVHSLTQVYLVGGLGVRGGPKRAPRGPKTAPRRPQDGPRAPQDVSRRSKTPPRRLQDAPRGPRTPPRGPRTPPGVDLGPIWESKLAKNRSQNAPETASDAKGRKP